jgi:hypothetical protein
MATLIFYELQLLLNKSILNFNVFAYSTFYSISGLLSGKNLIPLYLYTFTVIEVFFVTIIIVTMKDKKLKC